MTKTSKNCSKKTSPAQSSSGNTKESGSIEVKHVSTKLKRSKKSVPRESPLQRSSAYRGVTRHRWTGRYEAHLWDKNCWNKSQNKKGRQVYLGAYNDEEAAAHAYDLAALKYWGPETILNFPLSTYQGELKDMEGHSREEYIGSLRRKSSGFSRGVSKYRGVARHHHNGRWEARIGRVLGNKYLYLGTYATEEEAATAYDMAAIEHRGLNAVTNFDLSCYIKWLEPNNQNINPNISQASPNGETGAISNPIPELGFSLLKPSCHQNYETTTSATQPGSASASSALGLLLQSSEFKEMLDMSNSQDSPSTPPESDQMPRRSFPDDIQTYFDCLESNDFSYSDHNMFGDLNSFAPSSVFSLELES